MISDRILMETGLSPTRLELEITESTIIADKTRTLHTLRQIRALGVTIPLDDFRSDPDGDGAVADAARTRDHRIDDHRRQDAHVAHAAPDPRARRHHRA